MKSDCCGADWIYDDSFEDYIINDEGEEEPILRPYQKCTKCGEECELKEEDKKK